ncbi:MAG TPA: iron-sulfur cluster assembly scaffold protein [Deltaproteobacteria bacterium]|nr:iron-sulfur cluster assembly scaffold protein [Deltaproteobacteria bacterium]HOM29931.1 iron-sulfur cluster assembly scaffold protein [Deltaproteobacteria bacterium]HPP79449.1 iron-sulfur cluster assembly scaffold protein [Deltaproteobacteria bacterium]
MDKVGWVYSDKVLDHFMHPRNILEDEQAFQADGVGVTGNVKCGDQMIVAIKVDAERGVITDCKWKTFGCASAIASTSIMSEMVKGMRLEDAFRLSPRDINKELGGLPEHKIHCSVLGDKALRAAINDYYEKTGQAEKIQREEARVVCSCMNVTDHEIEEAVLEGARSLYEVQEKTKVATVCGECTEEVERLIEFYTNKHFCATEGRT